MDETISKVVGLYNRVADLSNSAALLEWDQETYMPDKAAHARAAQIATLRSLAHEYSTSAEMRRAVEDLASFASKHPEDTFASALARVGKRDLDLATRLPTDFVHRSAKAEALAKGSWKAAREADDFAVFAEDLQTVVELASEKADLLGYEAHPYDALIDQFEPGTTTEDVIKLFTSLRAELVPIVEVLSECIEDERGGVLRRHYDANVQWQLGQEIIRRVGYDFLAGRQDKSLHPFCTTFSISDVRITTRVDEDYFSSAFFGTLHEMGHALYEQGIDPTFERTPLADGTSLGIHESQSRLWENLVGRGRPFIDFAFPLLQQHFPDALSDTTPEHFYRAVNTVRPSLIRVEADEVTYNLHIMVRFELERALLEGRLAVTDLPTAWNDLVREYLGLEPASDADGVLQDIHWSMGAFGYFPTYAIGNLMASQFYDAAELELDDIAGSIRSGNFAPLLGWLRTNIHQHGRCFTAPELMERVTGSPLSARSWLKYIRSKYSDLYEVKLDEYT